MEKFFLFEEPELIFQNWQDPEFEKRSIQVSVLRSDLVHPWIQGNKWYKLRHFAKKNLEGNFPGFVSVGGPYSNHLIALSYLARIAQKRAIFYVRGSSEEWIDNPAIKQMKEWGAEIRQMTRAEFRVSNFKSLVDSDPELSEFVWVPQGGTSFEMVEEIEKWAKQILNQFDFDVIVLPTATAGTISGFASYLPASKKIIGIEVIKASGYLEKELDSLLSLASKRTYNSPEWNSDYHFGGYAKKNLALSTFCTMVLEEKGFPIEPIYSGKAFFAVSDLIQKGHFEDGNKILLIHTGGVFPWNIGK
jgi:1-aminocyclopropane-1-carboxylate deaminase